MRKVFMKKKGGLYIKTATSTVSGNVPIEPCITADYI